MILREINTQTHNLFVWHQKSSKMQDSKIKMRQRLEFHQQRFQKNGWIIIIPRGPRKCACSKGSWLKIHEYSSTMGWNGFKHSESKSAYTPPCSKSTKYLRKQRKSKFHLLVISIKWRVSHWSIVTKVTKEWIICGSVSVVSFSSDERKTRPRRAVFSLKDCSFRYEQSFTKDWAYPNK